MTDQKSSHFQVNWNAQDKNVGCIFMSCQWNDSQWCMSGLGANQIKLIYNLRA